MNTLVIQVGAGQARLSGSLVTAPLWLRLNERAFPNERWTDSVVVVLTWFAKALAELLEGSPGPIEVRFMEGPFFVEIQDTLLGGWHVRLEEDGSPISTMEAIVEIGALVLSLLECCDQTLAICKARGWSSVDVDALQVMTRRVQAAFRRRTARA